VIDFAASGTLMNPVDALRGPYSPECRVSTLARAFQIYAAPLQDESFARSLHLAYLPDRVANEQGKLTEYGTEGTELLMTSVAMKEKLGAIVFGRIGELDSDLANETTGLLCAVLEARLVRNKNEVFFEKLFDVLKFGYWPCGLRQVANVEEFFVYTGGLDRGSP
jgi:hypothetical protein